MRERSKIPALLTELAIMILVFALCAAVCIAVFASARSTSKRSRELTGAASLASSAAQAYKVTAGDAEAAAEILGAELSQKGFSMSVDGHWKLTENGAGEYTLTLQDMGDSRASIVVSGPDGEIFTCSVEAVRYG